MLDVKDMTFQRGESGNLLPQDVVLDTLPNKPTVKIRPLTRGKLQEIYAMATGTAEEKLKADNEVILNGLVEPVVNEETLKDIRPQFATAIAIAIISASLGMSQEEVGKEAEKIISEQETELKKN